MSVSGPTNIYEAGCSVSRQTKASLIKCQGKGRGLTREADDVSIVNHNNGHNGLQTGRAL